MQSFAASLLNSNNIQLEFDCDPNLKTLEFGIETRQHLYLIFKEAVNSIAKHSGAASVKITLSLVDKNITLNITDDGRGIKPASNFSGEQNIGGIGLKNMKKRAETINGKLTSESSAVGARIQLEFEHKT